MERAQVSGFGFLKIAGAVAIAMAVACALTLGLGANTSQAHAATVTKVTKKCVTEGYSGYYVITGKTKSGKKVWTWKSRKGQMAQVDFVSFAKGGKYVYIIDNAGYTGTAKLIQLKKSTGKVLRSKKVKGLGTGTMKCSSDGKAVFIDQHFSGGIWKFNYKLSKKWKVNPVFDNSIENWIVSVSSTKIKVKFDNWTDGSIHTAYFSVKDGHRL